MHDVIHLSAFYNRGGAAIAAERLHQGMLQLGVDSAYAVPSAPAEVPSVISIDEMYANAPLWDRAMSRVRYRIIREQFKRYRPTLSHKLELFSDDRMKHPGRATPPNLHAPIFNLHWIAGFVDYRRFFSTLGKGQTVVWTLHDMGPFTGGCHYALGCERFEAACGACFQLGSKDPSDLSARVHARKAQAFSTLAPSDLHIVAPSRWLADEARKSALFGRFPISVIANGIDMSVFAPRDRAQSRQELGLHGDATIVLFVSDLVVNYRKGFDLLEAAVARADLGPKVQTAAIGDVGKSSVFGPGCVSLGRFEDEGRLAAAYSAADVLVLPSRADNLPNVAIEAMACGLPVIAFDVGGIRDIVVDGETGFLVPEADIDALAACLSRTVSDSTFLSAARTRCRTVATRRFDLPKQAQQYLDLYETLRDTPSDSRDRVRQ
ncbi:MAG: glycosyltransferase [Pseudomonadota bacterium]